MFGLATAVGRTAHSPHTYNAVPMGKPPKNDSPLPPSSKGITSSADSLEPAIDGPPSPERIRAYTEQMKRSSIFGNNSRTNTLSSATSSFRSRELVTTSTDNLNLSRKSSGRLTGGSMSSSRADRPERVQVFARSLFSRRGRRTSDDKAGASSSGLAGEDINEEGLAKERYYGQGNISRRRTLTGSTSPAFQEQRTKHLISRPFNFQHVTHTKQEYLPDLDRSSETELASEFTALRASQSPTKGELKGIRADDLHFENFSSEALGAGLADEVNGRPKSAGQRKRGVLRKPVVPPLLPTMSYAKSHDNVRTRSAPPPRPPRSPMSPPCPVALPARTSSRRASVLFDTFDPLATTTISRPETSGRFRRPVPFLPTAPPPPQWSEQEQYFSDRPMSHAMSPAGEEAWPFTTPSPSGNFGAELADVQEEEEEATKRRSRMSTASGELRISQLVPALRLRNDSQPDSPETRRTLTMAPANSQKLPLSPGFQMSQDSWDNAIDYAYEHEAEADCDYQWDRYSVEDDDATIGETPSTYVETPVLDLNLEEDDGSVYNGRVRPSLLVPSTLDVPELSPISDESTTPSDPRTPSNFLRPVHVRSRSHASSFKESHGFDLSPSLLIPSDFNSQMEQDALYEEQFHTQTTSASIFAPEPYHLFISPVDESTSSTASYRSSAFSRGSARSSSSTRISGTNSCGSQDSMILLQSAGGVSQEYRSIEPASSLPDLIPSILRQASDSDLSQGTGFLTLDETDHHFAPTFEATGPSGGMGPLQHRRKKSLAFDQVRQSTNHFAPQRTVPVESEPVTLSPMAETSFLDSPHTTSASHGRKVSAPILSPTIREFKARERASTTSGTTKKSRGGYMLFPQV